MNKDTDLLNPANERLVERIKNLEERLDAQELGTQQQAINWYNIRDPMRRVDKHFIGAAPDTDVSVLQNTFWPGQIFRAKRASDVSYAYGYVANVNVLQNNIGLFFQTGPFSMGIPASWAGDDIFFSIAKVGSPKGFSEDVRTIPTGTMGTDTTFINGEFVFTVVNNLIFMAINDLNISVLANVNYVEIQTDLPTNPIGPLGDNDFFFDRTETLVNLKVNNINRTCLLRWLNRGGFETLRITPTSGVIDGDIGATSVYHVFTQDIFTS